MRELGAGILGFGARLALIVLGAGALLWAVATYRETSAETTLSGIANRILQGEQYKVATYSDVVNSYRQIEAEQCHPGIRGAAVIRLAILEQMIADGERTQIDSSADELRSAVRRSLACFPSDPYLWIVLYWLENTASGFSPRNFAFLRLSYELGPNEGWIALRRNRLALALYNYLPPDLTDKPLAEFGNLIRSHFDGDAVDIFASITGSLKEKMTARLLALDEPDRRGFLRILFNRGYGHMVPGMDRREPRPWH